MVLPKDSNGEYPIKNYNLIKARKGKGFSQENLAEKIGVDRVTYLNYELLNSWPDKSYQKKIAKQLDEPVDYLFRKNIESNYKDNSLNDVYENCEILSLPKGIFSYTRDNEELNEKEINLLFDRKTISKWLEDILTEKEKEIIDLRYGLREEDPYTFKEIGKKYEISHQRVHQIELQAMDKLKKHPLTLELSNYFY